MTPTGRILLTLFTLAVAVFSFIQTQPLSASAPTDRADSTYIRRDTLLNADTVFVITTACAPICSSVVQIYTLQGERLGMLASPFPNAVFPEAYIEDERLRWRDNTPQD